MNDCAQRNRDRGEQPKAAANVETPTMAPSDAVTNASQSPNQQERGQRNVDAKQHGEHISQPPARVGPKPMRRRKLHRHPHAGDRAVVLPGSGCMPLRGSRQSQWNENESSDRTSQTEPKSICPQRVKQVSKKDCHAQQISASGSETRSKKLRHAAGGKQQQHGEIARKGSERSRKSPAAIPKPGG